MAVKKKAVQAPKTDLQRLRDWLATYPGYDILGNWQVDYTDQVAGGGGVYPHGLVEISRSEDILGNVTVRDQYNFGLYVALPKAPGDDVGAEINADWLMDFQRWVQRQSVAGLAPRFGDDPRSETIKANSGALYDTDAEGMAIYMAVLSAEFTTKYEVI